MKKSILFTLPIFIFLALNFFSYAIFPGGVYFSTYTSYADINAVLANGGCDIANVGNSHALESLDYSVIPEYNALNLGQNGQNFYYDRMILEQYDHWFKDDTIMILPISYFHLLPYTPKGQSKYYKILDKDRIDQDVSLTEYVIRKHFSGIGINKTDSLIDVIKRHYAGKPAHRESTYDINDDERWLNHAESKRNYQYHSADASIEEMQPYANELKELIEWQQSKGRRVVLFMAPYYEYYNDLIDSLNFTDKFYGLLNNVITETSVEFYDYSRDPRFETNRELFVNTDHLNGEGAKLFSQIFFDEILN